LKTTEKTSPSALLRFRAKPHCDLAEAQRLLEYQIKKAAGFSCSLSESCNTIFDAMRLKLTRDADLITAEFAFNVADREFGKFLAPLEDWFSLFSIAQFEQRIQVTADFDVDIEGLVADNLALYEPFVEAFKVCIEAVMWKGNSGLITLLSKEWGPLSYLLVDSFVEMDVDYFNLTASQHEQLRKTFSLPSWGEFKSLPVFTHINKKVHIFRSFAKTLVDYFTGELHLSASLLQLQLDIDVMAPGLSAISPFT
jgi:hypothetical protein